MDTKEKTFLSVEEVNQLLPPEMKIDGFNKLERSVYATINGKPLPIVNSKYHEKMNCYWYSSVTKYFKEIGAQYICFTVGKLGILLIPIDEVLEYNKHSGWKSESKKGRQYHVRIKQDINGGKIRLLFIETKEDITKYLTRLNK